MLAQDLLISFGQSVIVENRPGAIGTERVKRVASNGYMLVLQPPAEFRNEIQTGVAAWLRVIRKRGVKAD